MIALDRYIPENVPSQNQSLHRVISFNKCVVVVVDDININRHVVKKQISFGGFCYLV